MGKSSVSDHETGWYFPGALDPGEKLPLLSADALPYPDADEMISLIEDGIAAVEAEANAKEPSPQTAALDIVDAPSSDLRGDR